MANELDAIAKRPDAPTLRELGDRYIRLVIKNSPSLAQAARRLGMSYKGMKQRSSRVKNQSENG